MHTAFIIGVFLALLLTLISVSYVAGRLYNQVALLNHELLEHEEAALAGAYTLRHANSRIALLTSTNDLKAARIRNQAELIAHLSGQVNDLTTENTQLAEVIGTWVVSEFTIDTEHDVDVPIDQLMLTPSKTTWCFDHGTYSCAAPIHAGPLTDEENLTLDALMPEAMASHTSQLIHLPMSPGFGQNFEFDPFKHDAYDGRGFE